MKRWLAVVLLAAFAALPARAQDTRVVASTLSSGWLLETYVSNTDNSFSHCSVGGRFDHNGVDLFFSLGPTLDSFAIALLSFSWNVQQGQTFPVSYRFDRRSPYFGQGEGMANSAFRVRVDDVSGVYRRVQRSNVLRVESPYGTHSFRLRGTNRALRNLRNCAIAGARRYPVNLSPGDAQTAVKATPAPVEQAALPGDDDDTGDAPTITSEQAVMAFANIMLASGLTDARLRTTDQEGVTKAEAEGFEATFEVISGSSDLTALRGELVAGAAAACEGGFSTRSQPVSGRLVMRLSASCDSQTTPSNLDWLVVIARGGNYLIALEHAAPAADRVDAITTAAVALADAG